MIRQKLTLNILALLLLMTPTAITAESNALDTTQQEAQAINDYAVGKYRSAIRLWKNLLQNNPRIERDKFGEISVLMALAQESLGYPREACYTLVKAIDANPYLCDLDPRRSQKASLDNLSLSSRHDVIAALTLANLLRDFGKFEQAKTLIDFSSPLAHQLNDERLIAGMKLSLADLTLMNLKLKRDRVAYRNLQLTNTEAANIEAAFADAYQTYEAAFDSSLQRDALSKWLQLHVEHLKFQSSIKSSSLLQTKYEQYRPNLDRLLSLDLSKSTDVEKIQYKLDLAQRIYEFGIAHRKASSVEQSFNLITEALRHSHQIENKVLLAQGLGQLGKLYLLTKQTDQALIVFKQASHYAQSINDVHQLYKWQYELAKIFKRQGNTEQATSYFEAAIATLKEVEWDVSPLSSELRINFQERTAPVFDDYLELLVDTQNPDYQKILSVQRKFSASELQNYLGCGTLQPVSADQIFNNDADAIVINIFRSGNEYYTIVEADGTIVQVRHTNGAEIDATLRKTRLLLDTVPNAPNRKISSLRYNLNQLYTQLIAPIEAQLESGKTLVFALDPSFQQIPIGMFFDGNQYLIEKHPVALIPPQLNQPVPVASRVKNNVFFAGISQARNIQGQQFSSSPNVGVEAEAIQPDQKALNQSFTQNRLFEQLAKDIPVFHVATHGQFSSDPEQTFILAWDDIVTLNSLTSIVGYRAQNTPNPIELLVLSACETAKGDPLAALGLAGFTVQAGTRSTLASLWRSEDLSSALLMEDFYEFWRAGNSKAKALQLAQVKQIQQGRSPYYWGGFVLVGSWL